MTHTYKAWIPTNNGSLSKELIASTYSPKSWSIKNDQLTLIQNDIDDYTDTVFSRKNELMLSYTLEINLQSEPWYYNLQVIIGNTNLIKSQGRIYSNGIVDFTVSTKVKGDQDNIANTIFTIVKNCIHGNSHHEQKVDKFIPIQDQLVFKYSLIAKQLANEIKKNEYETKRILLNNTTNTRKSSVINILYEQSRGFKSYYDAFLKIFEKEIKQENLSIGYPDAVLQSMKAIKNKAEIDTQSSKFTITIFFSLSAFFVSFNILIKPNHVNFLNAHYLFLVKVIALITVLIAIFLDLRYIGLVRKIFYPLLNKTNKTKDYFQRVYLYGEYVLKNKKKVYSDKKKYIYLYYFLKYGHFLVGVIMIVILFSWAGFYTGAQLAKKILIWMQHTI